MEPIVSRATGTMSELMIAVPRGTLFAGTLDLLDRLQIDVLTEMS